MAVFEATDGQDALEYFESYQNKRNVSPDEFPPMMVFLDINMPRLNGFEFLERFEELRKRQGLESTVIVMFTSSPGKKTRSSP